MPQSHQRPHLAGTARAGTLAYDNPALMEPHHSDTVIEQVLNRSAYTPYPPISTQVDFCQARITAYQSVQATVLAM